MDNKEFARLLLCEATELLESSGKNGLITKLGEKGLLGDDEVIQIREPDRIITRSPMEVANTLTKRKKELNKEYSSLLKDKKNTDMLDSKRKMHAAMHSSLTNDLMKEINNEPKNWKDAVMKKRPKSYYIHKKINDRAKKAQNESIAVLLTEAALLLNENYILSGGIRYTDNNHLLYADGEFIGSFDNNKEKYELIEEHQKEINKDKVDRD